MATSNRPVRPAARESGAGARGKGARGDGPRGGGAGGDGPRPGGGRGEGDAVAGAEGAGRFPVAAGILLGLGLGGFVDGIVLHQILQWHHMASSAGYPADTVGGLRWNTLFDGLFHAAAWVFVVAGLAVLWRSARRRHLAWPGRRFAGSLLAGFGLFNLVEGIVNHHLLGLHHVNETVPRSAWIWWDLGFLATGAAMLAAGALLLRAGAAREREGRGGASG